MAIAGGTSQKVLIELMAILHILIKLSYKL